MRQYLVNQQMKSWITKSITIFFPIYLSLPSSFSLSSCIHSFSSADPLSTGQDPILTVPQTRKRIDTTQLYSPPRKINITLFFAALISWHILFSNSTILRYLWQVEIVTIISMEISIQAITPEEIVQTIHNWYLCCHQCNKRLLINDVNSEKKTRGSYYNWYW